MDEKKVAYADDDHSKFKNALYSESSQSVINVRGQERIENLIDLQCFRWNAARTKTKSEKVWKDYKEIRGVKNALADVSSDNPFSGCAVLLEEVVSTDEEIK